MNVSAGGVARCLVIAFTLAFAAPAIAQDFPSKRLTIIIPATPGGAFEAVARIVGQKVSENTGQPVIVDPRAGGAGTQGVVAVKQAPPDGYTVLLGYYQTHVLNPVLLNDLPYDAVKDFKPVIALASTSTLLVVGKDSPFRDLAGLFAAAKARPGGLSYGHGGVGSVGHMAGEYVAYKSGTPFVQVPYRGAAQPVLDLVGGRLDLVYTALTPAKGFIDNGDLRVLASTAAKRIVQFPDAPTLKEAGFPDLELEAWWGIFAPVGTPDDIVAKLHGEFERALRDPGVTKSLQAQNLSPIGGSTESFRKQLLVDTEIAARVVKDVKLSVQ